MGGTQAVQPLIDEATNRIRRGIIDPNPGFRRVLGPPTAMASPPTVTLGTSGAASVITSPVTISATSYPTGPTYVPINTSLFRYLGGSPTVRGQSNPDFLGVVAANVQGIAPSGWLSVEFMTDAVKLEVKFNNKTATAIRRYMVDGQYISLTPYATATNGNTYRELIDFTSVGGAKPRRLTLELGGGAVFHGITVGPLDTVWTPEAPKGPRVVVLGDSYTNGTGSDGEFMSFAAELGKLMGWSDVWASGAGGTGYLAVGTSVVFGGRVATDVIATNADIVLVLGGQNDATADPTAMRAAADSLFSSIKAGLPNAKLIVAGPQQLNGSPTAAQLLVRDAIYNAAVAAGAIPIEMMGGMIPYDGTAAHYVNTGWITGTGKVSTPTGAGNADRYIGGATGSDGSHPTPDGHRYYARRLASAIAAAMPL